MTANRKPAAIGVLVIGLLSLTHAAAQTARPSDAWAPYFGCWQAIHESHSEAGQVCVTTLFDAAVSVTTLVNGKAALEQIIVADGRDHQISDEECKGRQQMAWSEANRLMSVTELTCVDQTQRVITGLSTIAEDGTWVDVQFIDIDGSESVRMRRYRREDGVRRFGRSFTVDEVIELSKRMPPRLIEAVLVESAAQFDLTGGDLLRLRKASVDPSIIDAMVALSFPADFTVLAPGSYLRFSASNLADPLVPDSAFDANSWSHLYSPFDFCYRGNRRERSHAYATTPPPVVSRRIYPRSWPSASSGETAVHTESSGEASATNDQEGGAQEGGTGAISKPTSGKAVTKRGYTRGGASKPPK